MNIIVINKSDIIPNGYSRIYIGRGSDFGNPFPMKNASQAERDRVCDNFIIHLKDEWLNARKGNPSPLAQGIISLATRVASGEKLALQCFCAPQRCHGDTIKETIKWLIDKPKQQSSGVY